MPVFSCMASRFGDAGVDELSAMMERISPHGELEWIIETAPVRARYGHHHPDETATLSIGPR